MDARPNVLLITADHWSGLHLGCNGNRFVLTPTIDQLAALGTNFHQAISACPLCVPARKSLMTGLSPKGHGDRLFVDSQPLPEVPTLAGCFADAGYQCYAVGKLHAFPPRNRQGFHDVLLNEEGRHGHGLKYDDWEEFLAGRGYAGQEFAGGGSNNDYNVTPWHLPDDCHPTNWAAREMCRIIRRRDPRKPGLWYLSFIAPHPPLWPLRSYLDQYLHLPIDQPVMGSWATEGNLPWKMRGYRAGDLIRQAPPHAVDLARRAFYAMITQIDHQIRTVLGTLREEGILNDTAILFTSDHGEMLGDHGVWAKSLFYEGSIRVPMVLCPPPSKNMEVGVRDSRLAELRDVMPTLLDLAGLPIPSHVEGVSLLSSDRRSHLYGEHGKDTMACRMIREERYKLIYYPEGNRFQLFDLVSDPRELTDLSANPLFLNTLERLKAVLAEEVYGGDEKWLSNGAWVGLPAVPGDPPPTAGLGGQRGYRFG